MLPDDKSKEGPSYSRPPYPRRYVFLIEEYKAYIASAKEARRVGDTKKYIDDLENAVAALDEFRQLVNEFTSSISVSRILYPPSE